MKLGIDVNLSTCKEDGYTIIEFDGRKPFKKDEYYNVLQWYPDYYIEESGTEKRLMIDSSASFNDLEEHYKENKKDLDSFSETGKHINFKSPTYYDFLNLASDILSYGGYFDNEY